MSIKEEKTMVLERDIKHLQNQCSMLEETVNDLKNMLMAQNSSYLSVSAGFNSFNVVRNPLFDLKVRENF